MTSDFFDGDPSHPQVLTFFSLPMHLAPVIFSAGQQRRMAEKAFRKSLSKEPQQSASYLGLAEIALMQTNPAKAEQLLRKGRKLSPDIPQVHSAWGRYLLLHGKFSEANVAFEKALRLSPESVLARWSIGHMYFAQKNYNKALRLDKTFADARHRLMRLN